MRDGIAKLISQTYTIDDMQQRIPAETELEVFVTEHSVSRQEWSVATGNGMNPEIMLETNAANYDDQRIVEYEGQRYTIYRVYFSGDRVEMYCEEEQGTL